MGPKQAYELRQANDALPEREAILKAFQSLELSRTSLPSHIATFKQSNQCEGTTRRGVRCRNRLGGGASGNFCHYHTGQARTDDGHAPVVTILPPDTVRKPGQCQGTTLKGLRCRNSPGKEPGQKFCHLHVGPKGVDEDSTTSSLSSAIPKPKRCQGMTKHGQQCRNSPAKGAGKQYCYLHTPQGSKDIPTPTSEAKNDTSVGFESWIPGDLSPTTKVKIRAKMAESLSQSENPGYVYAFEIVDPETPDYIHIKVGYSKNVLQRLSQWQRQCPSKEIKLRGGWPSTLKTEYVNQTTGEYVESIRFENPTKYPHRVEQLVHLELEDVALHSLHLKPEHRRPAASCPSMSRRCLDCGRLHREIFSFKRFTEPGLKGCEFDKVVLPVIEHWGRFVSRRG